MSEPILEVYLSADGEARFTDGCEAEWLIEPVLVGGWDWRWDPVSRVDLPSIRTQERRFKRTRLHCGTEEAKAWIGHDPERLQAFVKEAGVRWEEPE